LSDQPRALPDRPDLRFLKIEAKRRLAAAEFTTLHDAQLAIAREHGFTSWARLKESIDNPAVTHVRWVLDRFQDAGSPAWRAPGDDELREHFTEQYLSLVPKPTMIATLRGVAGRLRSELVVSRLSPSWLQAQVADLRIEASAEPSGRLTGLRVYALGARVSDPRVATPATRISGPAPESAVRVAQECVAELGLPGVAMAGSGAEPWSLERGWADLDRPEPLRPDHRLPAYGVAKVITATAVLCLVAEGRVRPDDSVNEHLRTVRLAENDVTVRELLTHTAGVPSPAEQFAATVPEPVSLLGATIACDGRRGTLAPTNAGFALLGQLIADVTGSAYPDAVARLIFEPLGMTRSSFPTRWPDTGAITGYHLAEDGSFQPAERTVSTMPAAGGLWTTATDLVRFGAGWARVLPEDLAAEALRPQVAQPGAGAAVGFGWLINVSKEIYGHPGAGPGGAASLLIHGGTVTVVMTNRLVPVEPVNARLHAPKG
jgi:CubicO group peptidase (beta-lactamase class C family)